MTNLALYKKRKSSDSNNQGNQRERPYVVSSGDAFVLALGPVSLWLDRETAEEVICLLADALDPSDMAEIAAIGSN